MCDGNMFLLGYIVFLAQIEGSVDKSARVLAEWRTTEAKAKKASHTAARENEKLQDAMLDVRCVNIRDNMIINLFPEN